MFINQIITRHFKGDGGINELLKISLPIIISQSSLSIMLLTDRFLLTPLGLMYPSASMTGGFLSVLWNQFFVGILTYITPLAAQYLGAKDNNKCLLTLYQGLIFSILVFPFLILGGYSLAPAYLRWTVEGKEEIQLALQYFNVVNAGAIFILWDTAFSSFFSGLGKTAEVMWVNIFGMFINIPLTYFLIHQTYVPEFSGMRGAALGTPISFFLMCILFILTLRKKSFLSEFKLKRTNNESKKPLPLRYIDYSILKTLVRYGGPTGVEYFLIFFAFSTFVAMFHSYGVNEALAMTITFNWDILAFYPVWGLNIGLMSLAGKYLGAKKIHLALRSTYSAAKVIFSLTAFFSLFILLFSASMVEIFIPDHIGEHYEAVMILGVLMLKWLILYCWGTAINLVYSATLRAAGDTRFCMNVSIIGDMSMLFTIHWAIQHWEVDPILAWVIYVGFIFFNGLLFAIRFYQGRWKQLQIV